jgi:hypothetical protein
MKARSFISVALALGPLLSSNLAVVAADVVLPLAAFANLRHDVFGNSYSNIYGITDLYANLNSINDDRAVVEFPVGQIPAGSTINSARLTIYVWHGGGTIGDVGTFQLFGYTGDGIASMADYDDQEIFLKSFTEGVPPTYGSTSFDVTSFVQSQNNSGALYSGFLFQAISQNVLMGFGCPGPNPFPWPTLDIKYTVVPEPTVPLLLLAAAMTAFVFLRQLRCTPRRS